jgi:hypothetical protein
VSNRPQRIAGSSHRRRRTRATKGLVHVQVRAPRNDTALIKAVAEGLRGEPEKARALRSALAEVLASDEVKTAFDVFGSDLADEVFADVFDQPRLKSWREVTL